MKRYGVGIWKRAPFLRLFIALTAGILLQYYCRFELSVAGIIIIPVLLPLIGYRYLSITQKFRARNIQGFFICILVACAGASVSCVRDISFRPDWIVSHCHKDDRILVTLKEPPIEKKGSFKALASVDFIQHRQIKGRAWQQVTGDILLYFRKDSCAERLQYGSRLLIQKSLQEISASHAWARTNYRQYCARQGIYYQLFLDTRHYKLVKHGDGNLYNAWLFAARDFMITTIQRNIKGPAEAGIAEALLIGYRHNLDKELLQSYSNTGVVHIIAISGMHLGMIYGLLLFLLKPLRYRQKFRWLWPLLVLLVLWGFSLLAGAGASILRAAVMFSFIIIGESISKKNHALNTLAASAFCLLLYNPSYLWDIGFQLSYAAVLGILLFMQPLYRAVYFKNRPLAIIWKLNALSLTAQVLTLPLLLYYFHQFPNLFLFCNFIAVPLSGIILYGCLLMIAVSPLSFISTLTGKALSWMILQMNLFIARTDRIPFAVTPGINISLLQTIVLYGYITCMAFWLMKKQPKALLYGLGATVLFLFIRLVNLVQ